MVPAHVKIAHDIKTTLTTLHLQPVLENDYISIELDANQKLLYSAWRRTITDKEFVAGAKETLKALQAHKAERLLANGLKVSTLQTDTKDWLVNTYYTALGQTNLKKLARVLPVNVFHKLALESVVTRASLLSSLPYEVMNFSSVQAGLNWLQEE